MAYEIITNSKKKKKNDDDIFQKVSEYARKKAYSEKNRNAVDSAIEPLGKAPTVPTVSTTVGSHTSDYGKFSGSHVKSETEEPEKKQDLAKQLAEAEEKWKQAQLAMDKNLYSEDLAGYKKAVDLAKANYDAIRKQMDGTGGEKEYGSVWELLADPDAHKSGLEDLKEATKEGWDALWGRNERGQKFWGGLTKANDVYGTKLEEDKQAIANAAKSEYKDGEATGWDVTGDTVMTGIAGINKMFTGTLDLLMPTEFLGKYDPFTYLSDVAKRDYTYYDAKRAAALDGKGKVAEFASEAGVAAVQAIPQAVMAVLSAGTSAAPTLAAGGAQATSGLAMTLDSAKTALSTMLQNPSYYVSVASTLGNDYEEAKAKGASDAQAAVYAIITSGINAGIEVSGGIETLPKELQGADGHALLKWVLSMPEEGLEELYQGAVSGGMEKAIFNPDKEIASKTNEDAIFHPGTMAKEFALGTAVGGLLGAPQVGAYAIGNKVADNRVAKVGESYTGTKEELIEEGLSFGEGYEAYKVAKELQQKVEAGEEISKADIGRAVIAINQSTRTDLKNALANFDAVTEEESSVDTSEASPVQSRVQTIQTRLTESGMDTAQAEVVAQSLSRILDGDTTVTNADKNVLSVDNRAAREVFEAETGVKLPSSNASTRKTVSEYIAQTAMKKQRETGADINVPTTPVENVQSQPVQQDTTVAENATVEAPQLKDVPDAKTTLHQAAINAVVGQAKADMNTLGVNGKRVYQKHIASAPNVGAYTNAFQRYYDAGAIGLDFVDLKTAYDRGIPRDVLYEAYAAGVNDATPKVKDNSPAGKKDAQKGKKQPSKGKGRVLDYRTSEGKAVAEKDMKALKVFARVFRVDIEIVDTIANEDGVSVANGHYANGKVTIAADSDNPIMTVLKHEVTHHIQRTNPAQYKAFKDYVMKAYYNNDPDAMNAEIKRRIALAKYNNVTLTRSEAMDEIVADATERFLTDRDSIDALVRENRTLGETILNAIRDVLRKVEAAMKGEKIGTGGAFLNADQLKKAEKMWVEALNGTLMEDSVGIQYDGESESFGPVWSLKTWNESEYVKAREEAAKMMAKQLGITKEKALSYIDDINGIARLIADDRVRLDYDSNLDENATVLKPNSDYKWSVDMSTLCAKRLLFTGTFDAIQKALPNTVFDSEDIVRLRKMMMDKDLQVACGICYVESTRREIGRITQEFIDRYKEAQKTGKPITRLNSEGKSVELKKTKDQMTATADKSTDKFFADKDYTPTLADLNTTDIDLVKRDHPLVYEAYLNFMNARGQAKPKLLETRAEYKGEILKHFKAKSAVKARNDHGGLRLQSFSDFEVPHMIDMMQVIMDMSRVGLHSQAYTKVPAFAEVFGGTGVKINLSLIAKGDGLDSNGNLIFDDVEGINHKEAFRLRDQYSDNVGTILVGKNDAHIIAAMADPRIDFVIPFHKSSWKESLYDALGLTGYADYTDTQNEKPIDKDRKISNFDPSEYWDFTKTGDENAQIYLEKCREDGRVPKFPQFQGYPGYWKLLIDFKMYNNDGVGVPQTVVRPDFNMDAANKILTDYEGGHRSFPVAKDVVSEFVSEYKAQKNTTENGGVQYDLKKRVAVDMPDGERYEVLKDRSMNVKHFDAEKMATIDAKDYAALEKAGKSSAFIILRKIGDQFGVFKDYHSVDLELGFAFSKRNLNESVHKQGGEYQNYARMMSVFDDVVDAAIGIEAHTNRYESKGEQVNATYVFASAFATDNGYVPVLLEVREFTDGTKSTLHVAVSLQEIERSRIVGHNNDSKITAEPYPLPASSTIKVADLFGNVNPNDGRMLKYIPDGFLNDEQKVAKQKAIEEEKEYIAAKNAKQFSFKDSTAMETDLNALREERADLEEQIDMADLNGLSDTEIRKLNNRLTKVNADIDKIVAEERKAVVKTPMQTILDNLGNYRRSDLESLAEQISEGAWDGYEDLSRTELEEALREEIENRELTALEMQNKKFGLYVRPVEAQPQYSFKDSDYMDAVNRGKKKKAQQMVDEAAVEAGVETGPDGKPIALYHGTPNFGFTTIDTKFSDDSLTFWATSDVSVAESYLRSDFDPKHKEARREIGNPKTESNDAKLDRKKHSEEAIVAAASVLYPEYKRAVHTDEEKLRVTRKDVKRAKKYGKELISSGVFTGENLQTLERFVDAVDAKTLENLANATKDVTLGLKDLRQEVEWNEKYDDLLEKFIDTVSDIEPFTKPGWIDSIGNAINIDKLVQNYNRNEGVYKLYYKAQTPFVIDCKGRAWNKISAPATMQTASSTVTTRDVARWAYERGYDSVKFENAVDMGSKNAKRTPATVWCFMNPKEQLWSADPVTYDDNGNVIPLSERFNAEKEDIRYQFKTPPELLELSEKIAAEEHKAKAVTDAEIMSQALNAIAKTEEEKSVVRNYQNAMKKLAAYEKDLAVYDAQKGEHEKGRSIYTDASGKVKKSGVKYSAEEKAEIQRKIELWKRNLKDIERKEAFQKVLKREKAKMAETHARKMSDLREAYNKRLDALREQRDAKVEAEKQKMRDYKQHQRDSKAYRELKAKLEADVKWLGDRLVHPTDAKHIPEDFKKVVAKFLESLDFTTKGMDERIAKTGEPSKKYIKMWSLIEAYQKIANDDSSNIELTPIEDAMLKSLKEAFEENRRVEDLNYEELNMVYDMIRWIKTGVASSNKAFNEQIKETVSEMGDTTISEMRDKKAKKEHTGLVAEADKLFAYDNITPADMFHRFGGVMEKLYGEIRQGFNKHIENTRTAIHEVGKIIGGHEKDIKKWSGKKATATKFTVSDGTTIELTPAQVMSLYVLMKREQAAGHVLGSGIVPSDVVVSESKKVGKGKITLNTTKKITAERASRVTIEDVAKIVETLSAEQMEIADSVVHLFTTKCADWGNETSMKLYGYKKFTEKNYFPIKSSDAYLNARFDDGGDVLIKNLGMTKNTVVNANNPIVVEDIFDVLTDHVNKMSMYNALVAPLTDFTRVFNYKAKDTDGLIDDSVQKALEAAHGRQAIAYVTQFMKDVNKQANTIAAESFGNKALTTFKKVKVGANLRVLVQQPTSIVRASAIIDPKYILKGLAQKGNQQEMLENSEIAYWKSLGFFDTDVGRSMKDILMDEEKWLDKVTMDMYGKADDFAWRHLWNAIKLEQADVHPDVDKTSSEFMDLVKARFEEVVDRTQVVDSVFHRSQLMRSKSVYTKMVTAFMSEPTKTYNLLVTELTDASKTKNKKKATRAIGTFVASAIATSMAAALVDAIRDDEDEDKEGNKRGGFRKYAEAVGINMIDNVVPLNLVPYLKEIVSIFSGYEVKRTDMELLSSFAKVAKKWTSGKHSYTYLIKETASCIAEIFGIPVRNALRDLDAIVGSTANLFGGLGYADYWLEKRRYDISNSDNRSKFYKHYTDALLAGDEDGAELMLRDMVANGIPYDNIIARGYQAEKPVAFAEAQKLIDAGKDTEAREVIRQLAKKYDKKFSTLWKAVKADESDVPEETYDFDDLQKAVKKGQDTELIEDYLTKYGGYSEEAMEEAIKMLTGKYK